MAQGQLPVDATQVKAELDKPEIAMQATPEFEASKVTRKATERPREWLEIEIPFELDSDSQIGIVPEVTMQFYVGVKGASSPLLLTDSFVYSNVPHKETLYSIIYVSPPSLARIAGGMDQFSERDVAAWGVEVLFNGRVVGVASSSNSDWWSANQAPRVTGFLWPKEDTPFRMLWIDRHVELKQN